MDQLHNLHLETVQEMGFIRAVNQALAKSLMVEFLRLKLITGDDLSTTLQTWHADMEATTEEFLRDLDSAVQTSTTLPSKNAAVEMAFHKYREVAKLKLALPLTQLDAAQEEMEKFISIPSQGAAVSAGDKASGHGAFLKDYRPSKQGMPIAVQ